VGAFTNIEIRNKSEIQNANDQKGADMPKPTLSLITFVLAASLVASRAEAVEVSSMVLKLVETIEVPAEETGVLADLRVAEGQIIRPGELLAQIDDDDARLALERAKIEYAVAQSNAQNDVNVRFAKKAVDVAKAELQRSLDSINKYPKSISASEMDRLKLVVEKNFLEVEQAQHEFDLANFTVKIKANDLQAAESKLTHHRIAAVSAGIVAQVHRHRGEWVRPGEPVLRVLRLDRLRAEGFLKSQDVTPGLLGRTVKLVIEQGGDAGREVEGKISFVDPEIDPVNSQVRVWVDIGNADLKLRPGMRAKMMLGETGKAE
jgi:macrolide-specific efflux system membrane fusion protein